MNTSTKVILGIVGAAAAGVAIGMLLAPEKGSDIRQKVRDTANDWATQLADLFAEGKSEFENIKNKAVRTAENAMNEAEKRYSGAKENFS